MATIAVTDLLLLPVSHSDGGRVEWFVPNKRFVLVCQLMCELGGLFFGEFVWFFGVYFVFYFMRVCALYSPDCGHNVQQQLHRHL